MMIYPLQKLQASLEDSVLNLNEANVVSTTLPSTDGDLLSSSRNTINGINLGCQQTQYFWFSYRLSDFPGHSGHAFICPT